MSTQQDDQILSDEEVVRKVMEGIEDLPEDAPDAVKNTASGDPSSKDKAVHEFIAERKKVKALANTLKQKEEEIAEFKRQNEAASKQNQLPLTNQEGEDLADPMVGQFTLMAMQNLGLTTATAKSASKKRLIEMETNRLYTQSVEQLNRENAIRTQAPQMVSDKLKSMGVLDDAGVNAVKSRLQRYSVTQQVDDEVVRMETAKYLGELMMSGGSMPQVDAVSSRQQIMAGMNAAASVSNGRTGLRPPERRAQQEKPANSEEAAAMKKMGIPLQNVNLYRSAIERKQEYTGR